MTFFNLITLLIIITKNPTIIHKRNNIIIFWFKY